MRQFTHLQQNEREVIQKMIYSEEKYSRREIVNEIETKKKKTIG